MVKGNFKQNIEHNRLEKRMPERKIGEKKGKVDSSLFKSLIGTGWASPTQISNYCDHGWIVTFPKVYLMNMKSPTL